MTSPDNTTPSAWYALVTSASMVSYLDHFRGMEDPCLEPMPSEGADCAKLSSSVFAGFTDYEDVLGEARKLAEIMTGAMKVRQGPANLTLKNVVRMHDGGKLEVFPPHGRPVSVRFGRPTFRFIKEGDVRDTIEKSVLRFALGSDNVYVQEVLRAFAQSEDWIGLYRMMETIGLELNEHDGGRKKNARKKIIDRDWASRDELVSFHQTAETYRHRWDGKRPRSMGVWDAQALVGRIVERWLREIARRPR